ncbi:MAG: DUF4398 domain-containing protein [Deltaproteobacteria bacterium]|nr:DUF4398 domain-containing protein [Deltaproteobacteria bacterium]
MVEKRTRWQRSITASLVGIGAVGFIGCSSVSPPHEYIATGELALRNAQMTSASQHAPVELRMAMEKLGKAKQAMRDKNYVTARQLAEQALVDAQLAENKAHAEEARRAAREMRARIEALRREAG